MSDAAVIRKLAILVGGGPAPGINGVISAATIEAINNNFEVLGIQDGYKWLVKGRTDKIRKLTISEVSSIYNKGGSILGTSRTNPAKSEKDMFGHAKLGGIGDVVAEELKERSTKFNGGKRVNVVNQRLAGQRLVVDVRPPIPRRALPEAPSCRVRPSTCAIARNFASARCTTRRSRGLIGSKVMTLPSRTALHTGPLDQRSKNAAKALAAKSLSPDSR